MATRLRRNDGQLLAGRSTRHTDADDQCRFYGDRRLTLALGIGANTAIFSVVNAVLLRPLPYPEAGRLVRVAQQGGPFRPGGGRGPRASFVTSDTFEAWRESTKALDGLAAYAQRSYTLTGLGDPIRLRGTAVSAAMFPMLRVTPEKGRVFSRAEEQPGADQVAVISRALWTRRFSRDPAIVGKPLMLDGQQITVVGVPPPTSIFPIATPSCGRRCESR